MNVTKGQQNITYMTTLQKHFITLLKLMHGQYLA